MHIDLTQGVIKEHIIKLAVPAVIGYFFHTMFNVTDTIFAGMISTQALAALSLSGSIFFMVLAIGIGMSEAVTSLVGNAFGKKDIAKAEQTVLNSLVFAVILSIFLITIGILGVPYLVDALGDPSYVSETYEYINPILYGSFLFIVAFFLNAILNATGDTISFRNILIFTAILNVFLDYIFIIEFQLGVSAIAYATLISEGITVIYLFYKVRRTKIWCGCSKLKLNIDIMKELLKQGFPPSINMFMMAFGMYIITYFVAPFGKEAVGAFGIGMRIEQIFLMPVVGINIAVLSIISQNNGAKTFSRIPETVKLAIGYGWMISTLGVASFFIFGEFLASLMTSDPLVIKQAALYLRIAGLASYGFVIIFVYIGMLQGIAKPAVIFPVSVYRQLIAPIIVFSALSYFDFGIFSMWVGLDLIIFSSAIYLWWYSEKKLKLLSH
ncbi:MATE family efflux transporter [Sulfurimonas sp.]|uniref:MATE family efflux transporter n=1 Tax=Sulfurimonas sp. TaxID=2022749 RepID=UPI00356591AA